MATITLNDKTVKTLRPGNRRRVWFDSAIRGFGFRLEITGAGAFFYQYRPRPGTRAQPVRRVTIGAFGKIKAAAAREQAKRLQGQVAEGRDPWLELRETKQSKAGKTVAQAVDAFLEARKSDARPQTLSQYRRYLDRCLLAEGSRRPVSEVTTRDLRRALGSIDGPVAEARAFAALSVFWAWATAEELVPTSPIVGLRKPAARTEGRDRVLDEEEIRDVWIAAEGLGYPFGPIVRLLLLLAQRRQETAGMRWSEVDLTEGTWSLPAGRAKARIEHLVPLPKTAIDLIDAQPRQQDEAGELDDLIFTTTGRTAVSGWGRAKERLDTAIAKARAKRQAKPMEPWTLHDLRRTVVTQMAKLGVDEGVADRVIAHAASSTRRSGAARVYQKYKFAEEKRKALERWSAKLMEVVSYPQDPTLTSAPNNS